MATRDLAVHFPVRKGSLGRATGVVRAVDCVSIDVAAGTTLGIVGESGSGKSTLGRAILHLIEPTSGDVLIEGEPADLTTATARRSFRRSMQIVFQDPAGALNPAMRIGDAVAEPARVHHAATTRADARRLAASLLDRCGLDPASIDRFPHEFSGGQRQRIVIARALATNPRFIVCDEPTSALDVSVQSQVLNLLRDLQRDLNLAYLFITHDIAVVRIMAPTIAVMRAGRIVETGPTEEILRTPREDYTRELLSAVPRVPARAHDVA